MSDFEKLYHTSIDMVYEICVMYLKNTHDAQDAAQDTFAKVLCAKSVPTDPVHAKAWLIVVTKNVCKNKLRRQKLQRMFLHAYSDDESPADALIKSELHRMILDLPENIKLSIYLHYYVGYTSAQIGQILGKSDAAVRKYLQQGRQKLKTLLEEDEL